MAARSFVFLFAIVVSSRAVNLGDRCSLNAQCSYILNAECRDSTCQCIISTITYQNACVQPVEPHSTCTFDDNCKSAASDPYRICVNGVCTCVPYFNWNGSCRRNRGLYEYCTSDTDCYWGDDMVGLMTCTGRRCSCIAGYLPRDKKCVATGV